MMDRRTYLEGSGIILTVALAGCTDTDGSTGDDTQTADGSAEDGTRQEGDGSSDEDVDHEEIDRDDLEAMTRAAVDDELEAADDTDPEEDGLDEPDAEDEAGDRTDSGGDGNTNGTDAEADTSEADENETEEPAETDERGPALDGTVYVQVDYDEDWVLAYSTRSRTGSFDGSDLRPVEIEDGLDVVSIAVQKADDSDAELTAVILLEGEIRDEASTTEPFGIARATHSVL